MKFLTEFLPDAAGNTLPIERQCELARAEFEHVGAKVTLVQLDPHYVATDIDSPFAVRPYADDAVVVDIADLGVLCRYLENTGRNVNVMAGSCWESTGGGSELLRHKLFISAEGYCER